MSALRRRSQHETLAQRQAHYDEHFSNEPEAPRVHGSKSGQHDGLKAWFTPYVANKGNPETQNIFWYPSQTHHHLGTLAQDSYPCSKEHWSLSREG
ncbi:uncharacterized protein B0H18DRAFT_489547 [Fomitopsis serialis]|uniref:uncharacterized protein n=1 Tax=Fomitopsis serialis TaxID=139415 RepID=UPI0020087FCB|nr:uncharacterized protein B0H18DRAFT_489547 [Neoantrodia serialis]KAH9934837.1 hypothetical protein B0H18DRAFT_489547 [Neoantrodia serialis]